jgi:hypothetical protein
MTIKRKTRNIRKKNKKSNKKNNKKSTRKMRGGASVEQIGRAAAMRSYMLDSDLYTQLSKVVHSGDKNPHNFMDRYIFNPYADSTLSHDRKVELLLNDVRDRYNQNKTAFSAPIDTDKASKPAPSGPRMYSQKMPPLKERLNQLRSKKTEISISEEP